MSLAERQIEAPVIGLGEMLAGDSRTIGGTSAVTLPGYVEEILASGFPVSVHSRAGRDGRSSTVTSRALSIVISPNSA